MARDGKTKDYDPYLIEKIQPQGGITFREPAMKHVYIFMIILIRWMITGWLKSAILKMR